MSRFFTRRPADTLAPAAPPGAGGLPRQVRRTGAPGAGAGAERLQAALRCESYAPGHQMHYIHQGQALRSPATLPRNVIIDDPRVVVLLADGEQHDFGHHDLERLEEVLSLFPASRSLHLRFHALRVGPYWFNLGPVDTAACPGTSP